MPRKISIEEAHGFVDSKPGWTALTTPGRKDIIIRCRWGTFGWATTY